MAASMPKVVRATTCGESAAPRRSLVLLRVRVRVRGRGRGRARVSSAGLGPA